MAKYNSNYTLKERIKEKLFRPIKARTPLVENKFDTVALKLKRQTRKNKIFLGIIVIETIALLYLLNR